jgi:hypothetical protein
MDWLTGDLSLLESDLQTLRQHLGWLADDLARQGDELGTPGATLADLLVEAGDCLARFAALDAQLAQARGASHGGW